MICWRTSQRRKIWRHYPFKTWKSKRSSEDLKMCNKLAPRFLPAERDGSSLGSTLLPPGPVLRQNRSGLLWHLTEQMQKIYFYNTIINYNPIFIEPSALKFKVDLESGELLVQNNNIRRIFTVIDGEWVRFSRQCSALYVYERKNSFDLILNQPQPLLFGTSYISADILPCVVWHLLVGAVLC
jgi:hypothetical protein